jgi:YD repeat-containing protein
MSAAPTGKITVGHTVDVATGMLSHDFEDYRISGNIPLILKRRYNGALTGRDDGMFGPGWICSFEIYLFRDLNGFHLLAENSETEITFDDPDDRVDAGNVVRNPGSFHELRAHDAGYVVTRWNPDNGTVINLVFKKGAPGEKWPLYQVTDLQGYAVRTHHDRNGRLSEMWQPRHGRGFRCVYNENDRIIQVYLKTPAQDSDNHASPLYAERLLLTYDYDANGRLSRMTDALEQSCHYEYDRNGRISREVNPAGMEYLFSYDDRGRCIETTGADHFGFIQLDIDEQTRCTRVTDALGQVTTYEWNIAGQVERETSPLGNTQTTVYDEYGRIIQTVTSEGRAIRYKFDQNGDRINVTSPDGASTHYTYNERHQIVSVTDPAGHVWRRAYDTDHRISQVINPLGDRMTFAYSPSGELITIRNPLGNQRHFEWNAYGHLIGATDWQGRLTLYSHDAEGRLVAVTDPKGYRTEYALDPLGRVIAIDQPDGTRRQFSWAACGHPSGHIDENGVGTRWHYTPCGYPSEKINPDQGSVRFIWSLIPERLDAVINENNERYTFLYDAAGRMICEKDFAGRTTLYEYDGDNLVTKITHADGRVSRIEHDAEGRRIGVYNDDGSETTYAYDERHLLIRCRNGDCEVERVYDEAGQLVREIQGGYVIQNRYDAWGNRTRRDSSAGTPTRFAWNPSGFLAELIHDGFQPVRFTYDENHNETTRRFGEHVDISQAYDIRDRRIEQIAQITKASNNAAPPNPIERHYRYDAAGNLTDIKDRRTGDTLFAYDDMGRTVSAVFSGKLTETFSYDTAGNMRFAGEQRWTERRAVDDALWRQCDYGPGNLPTRNGDTRYRYDALGRLIEKQNNLGKTAYTWNDSGYLAEIKLPDGSRWRYQYDPFGRRIAKHGPEGSVIYVWDGDVILHEIYAHNNGDRAQITQWDYHPKGFEPICKLENNKQYLCINDITGNPMELIDKNGLIVWSGRYTTRGKPLQDDVLQVKCPIRPHGRWHDPETDLHYHRFGYLDPDNDRFISPAPISLAGAFCKKPKDWNQVSLRSFQFCKFFWTLMAIQAY